MDVIRRLLVLVVLAATGLAQGRALACPMGMLPVADADSGAVTHAHHGGSAESGAVAVDGEEAPVPFGPAAPCGLMMTCGPVAASTPVRVTLAPNLARRLAEQIRTMRLVSTDILRQTPPPRSIV